MERKSKNSNMKRTLFILLLLCTLTATAQVELVTRAKPQSTVTKTTSTKPVARKSTSSSSVTRKSTSAKSRISSSTVAQKTTKSEFDYYLTQAQKGDAASQFYVAECYSSGENGVRQDDNLAKYWYGKAAEQGHVEAMSAMGDIYSDNNNYEQAFYWYNKAAEKGDVSAAEGLGEMYLFGQGVEIDYEAAAKYLKYACDQNDIFGKYYYGYCLYYGAGVRKDVEQARYYYNEAKTVFDHFNKELTPYSQMDPPAKQESDLVLYSETENPKVSKQHKDSKWGIERLTYVSLTDKFTLIEFSDYQKEDGWIALSSGTIMRSKYSQKSFDILDWGYKDSDGNYKHLDFDQQCNVNKGGNYKFYMVFEPVDHVTDNISIYENGKEAFFWEGVQLSRFDAPANSTSSKKDSKSDEQKVIAKFIVTNAKENGTDITYQVVNQGGAYTVFYSVGEQTYMANYMQKHDTQSWGPIYDFNKKTTPETTTSYETQEYSFSWNYSNSYDSKTGTCKCVLTKIVKPQGIVSVLKMVTESLDVIEYTGYMEGTVDFSKF